jgi:hypothetical protein
MTSRILAALAVVFLACATPRVAQAQTAADALAQGIRAYQSLEYDSAGALLRGALALPGAAGLADSDRVRALVYLGATELFREHRDTATAAFRELMLLDPRYRPSQLIFPPEVSSLFEEVRLGTKAVAVVVPAVTEIAADGDRLVVRLYATSYHQMTVVVTGGSGVPPRTLYTGAIGDSLEVLWDGRDSTRLPVYSGDYVLRATSRGPEGGGMVVDVPLEIRRLERDTLPLPPRPADSLLRPERTAGVRSPRSLLTGLAAAAAVVALPPLVAGGAQTSSARYGVAAAIGVSGLLGFRMQQRPRPIPENIAANQTLRRAWERQAEATHAENVARQRNPRLLIRAGPPRTGNAP